MNEDDEMMALDLLKRENVLKAIEGSETFFFTPPSYEDGIREVLGLDLLKNTTVAG